MAWLTRVFTLCVCVSVVTCHVFFGQHHRHALHHISELPKVISSIIKQSLDHSILQSYHDKHKPESVGDGGYQLGIGNNGKPQGSSNLDFNFKPSDIFGGNLFGSQEFIDQGNIGSGSTRSQEPGESSSDEGSFLNPGDFTGSVAPSGEIYDDSQTPNSGTNIDIPNGPGDASKGDNGGNLNTNNETPSQDNVNDGSTSEDINAGINKNNGIGNVDGSGVAQSGKPEEATNIDGQGPFVPSSVGVDGNIRENKQNTLDSTGEKPKANVNINLNVPGDVLDSVNLHFNVPNRSNTGTEVGTLNPPNSTLDINKPEGQISNSDLAIGVEGQKLNRESAPFQNSDNLKVGGEVHSSNLDTNSKQSLNDTKESVHGLQLAKEDESNHDGKLKINEIVDSGVGDLDFAISKHRDKHSIVFPDKLNEAKEKIQKQKINVNDMGASQTPNLSGRNGIDNGQILYAINIAPALTSSNQGSYVPAAAVSTGQQANYVVNNAQNVPVSGQSGTPVQYVVQNPSNTRSNIVPNTNVVYSSPSGGISSGYTTVNVPNSGNNPGQVLYNLPASYQNGQSNGYYQVNNNPSPQTYYTVQLSNGQTALVPVSSGQMYTSGHNNGQGQVMIPSNSPQYVVSNSQPIQSNGQVLVSNNGQQYIPSNGNGQVFVSTDGQQYVLANSQPDQGNAQIVVPSNSQQYIQSNEQPANAPVMVLNGQNYVPNVQVSVPWNGGQGTVQNSGQVYVPLDQNPQNNMVAVPSGSIVNIGGDSNSVPLLVLQGFKDKGEPSSSPPSSDEVLDQSKDKIDDEKSDVGLKKNKD